MGSPLLFGPLLSKLSNTEGAERRGRPQPLHHPRQEAYPSSSFKDLSAYCYTCESRAVGAEVLLHLFFGELACKYCNHTIKSCSSFRTAYPMAGECKGSRESHNACRWEVPVCKYIMYHTRKHLSLARGINNKFSKEEVLGAATTYLRALLPLRGLYPWRSALKTIVKAGIAVNLSRPPPRLKQTSISVAECGEETGKARVMLGVSGVLQLEKSIARLEKNCSIKIPSSLPLSKIPQGSENTSEKVTLGDFPSSIENTPTSIQDAPASTSIHNTPASIGNTSIIIETLPKLSKKTKLKSISASSENTPSNTHDMEDTPAKVRKKTKKTKPKDAAADTGNIAVETLNSLYTEDTTSTTRKKAKLKNTSNIIYHLSHEGLDTLASTQDKPSNTLSKKTKLRKIHDSTRNAYTFAEDASPTVHEKPKQKNTPAGKEYSHSETLVPSVDLENTPGDTENTIIKVYKKNKKAKSRVAFTNTINTALSPQDALPEVLKSPVKTENSPPKAHRKKKLKDCLADADREDSLTITQGASTGVLNSSATTENTPPKKVKRKMTNTIDIAENNPTITHTIPEMPDACARIENTNLRQTIKAKFMNLPTFSIEKISATAPGKTKEAKLITSVNTYVCIEDSPAKAHKKKTSVNTLDAPLSEASIVVNTNSIFQKARKKKESKDFPASTQDTPTKEHERTNTIPVDTPKASPSEMNTLLHTGNTPPKARKKKSRYTPASMQDNSPISSAGTDSTSADAKNTPCKEREVKKLKNNPLSTENNVAGPHRKANMLQMGNTLTDTASTISSTQDTSPCVTNINTEDTLPKVQKRKKRKWKGDMPEAVYSHASTKGFPSKPSKRAKS